MGLLDEALFTLFWAVALGMTLLFVAARMLGIGLCVDLADVAALERDRSFVVRALLANVAVVPALGIAIAAILPLPSEAALAVLLVAAIGGGVDFLALAETRTAKTRSVTALVFVLSIVAIAVSPGVRLLLQRFGATSVASFSRLATVTVLVALLPLVAGVVIRRWAPALAGVLSRAMALAAVILFVGAALTTFVVKAPSLRAVGAGGIMAMALLVVGAGAAGWLLGGPSAERRAMLARVTAMRNGALSLALAIVSFPSSGVDVAILLFVGVEVALRLLAGLARSTVMASTKVT